MLPWVFTYISKTYARFITTQSFPIGVKCHIYLCAFLCLAIDLRTVDRATQTKKEKKTLTEGWCQLTLLRRVEPGFQAVEELIKTQLPVGILIRQLNEGINTETPG